MTRKGEARGRARWRLVGWLGGGWTEWVRKCGEERHVHSCLIGRMDEATAGDDSGPQTIILSAFRLSLPTLQQRITLWRLILRTR